MSYVTESEKIKDKVSAYLTGKILDIGCGVKKITPDAFGVDREKFPHVDFCTDELHYLSVNLMKREYFDCLFSSHTLEHLIEGDHALLTNWLHLLKKGGYLILYLPDARKYDNAGNAEHFKSYEYPVFKRWFEKAFPLMPIQISGEDFGPDQYSFYIVAQKQ